MAYWESPKNKISGRTRRRLGGFPASPSMIIKTRAICLEISVARVNKHETAFVMVCLFKIKDLKKKLRPVSFILDVSKIM